MGCALFTYVRYEARGFSLFDILLVIGREGNESEGAAVGGNSRQQ